MLALVGAWLAPVAAPPPALAASGVHFFNYTGAMQNWTVPAGVHSAHFDVRGAQGGGHDVFSIFPVIKGGEGGRIVAVIRVFPGEVFHIFVGGKGGDGGTCPHRNPRPSQSRGGFNGGADGGKCGEGNGGGGGGGASDIRVGGTHLTNRIIVAGGGGGSSEKLNIPCGLSIGGGGGGLNGADGTGAVEGCTGGTGATRTSGGVPHGSLGSGGAGRGCAFKQPCGGGGGGGYYGGGGGGLGAGGGGGSGLAPRVDFPPVKFYTNVQKGNGKVIITFPLPN